MNYTPEDEVNFHNALGHIGPFAVTDTLATAAFGYGLAKWKGWNVRKTVIMTFITGEIVHWWLGIDTPISTRLSEDNNIEKIALVSGSFLLASD
jgi:hypothetical protein